MAQRKSVLEPKPSVILAADQELAPQLNWRRWQTWGVFLGLGLMLSLANGVFVVFCAIAVELLLQDQVLQVLAGNGATITFYLIVYFALKRVFPVRDTAGNAVPGNPRLDLVKLPLAVLLAIPWATGFNVPFLQFAALARDVAGHFTEDFPIWGASVTVIFSFMVFEVPFRVLWRAPVQEPDRDD